MYRRLIDLYNTTFIILSYIIVPVCGTIYFGVIYAFIESN